VLRFDRRAIDGRVDGTPAGTDRPASGPVDGE